MQDASHNDINNATSTKQNVSSASGLLVLASNQSTNRYWHHFDPLGGGGPLSAGGQLHRHPTSGTAPLAVGFTDTSSGAPTAWAWDFTDDGTVDSNAQHPSHTYTTAGSHTARLTVSNAGGFDSTTRTITVNPAGQGAASPSPPAMTPTPTPARRPRSRAARPTCAYARARSSCTPTSSSRSAVPPRWTAPRCGCS